MSQQYSVPAQQPKKTLGDRFRGLSTVGKFRVVVLIVALLVAPFAIYAGLDEPNQAKVGDCMAGKGADDLHTVKCTDTAAEWKVLGRLEGKTEADHDRGDACNAFPDTGASFYQDGRRFRKGFILCLGPAKG
ncbi:LppU/SCO3897 family protein [Micromonospora zhanjiangensis]|uniref:Uncharacterized protein n=1 Tax=Micromonospora zhanjiangensis TaxID=1522057 RepID=A0ABV8KMV9_9ACTN